MTKELPEVLKDLKEKIDNGEINYDEAIKQLPTWSPKAGTRKSIEDDYTLNAYDPKIEDIVDFLVDIQNDEDCYLKLCLRDTPNILLEKCRSIVESSEDYFNRLYQQYVIDLMNKEHEKLSGDLKLYEKLKERFEAKSNRKDSNIDEILKKYPKL